MNKIKVVVFDFDNTLYKNVTFDDWKSYCNNAMRVLLKFLTKEQIESVIVNQKNYSDIAIIQTLKAYGISYQLWLDYRNNNLRNCDISMAEVVNNNTLKEFSNKYILYIATFNTKKHVESVSKKLGLNLSLFKDIITPDYEKESSEKELMYTKIAQKENVKPSELFIIGDNATTDIEPMIKIGGNGQVVNSVNFTLKDFNL